MKKENKKQPVLLSATILLVLVILVCVFYSKQIKESSVTGAEPESSGTSSVIVGTGEVTHPPSFAVAVQSEYYVGQGVVYAGGEDSYYIVTTAHLMAGTENGQFCKVTLYDGTEMEAVLLYVSEVADVAFLMLESERELIPVSQDRTQFDSLIAGDGITAYSLEENALVKTEGQVIHTWVYLEDFALDMMLAKLEGQAGMSGCAILNEEGYFVGVLCGVSESGEAAVLPYSVIASELIASGLE